MTPSTSSTTSPVSYDELSIGQKIYRMVEAVGYVLGALFRW